MPDFHPFGGRVSSRFGDRLAPDDAYLSYHDIRLTKLDVDTIKNDWLTDNAIAFWEEFLEHEIISSYKQANIILLRPSMSFMLLATPDPLTLKDALPDFTSMTHIFLPINDNRNVEQAEGGSHWSLLLVSAIDRVAFHYDSLGNANETEARIVNQKLSALLGISIRFINMDDTPLQENGSDCGVFVCLIMRYLLVRRLLKANANEKVGMSMHGRDINATLGRKEMLKIIEEFRKEGQKRSSSRSRSPIPGFKDRSKSPPRIGPD